MRQDESPAVEVWRRTLLQVPTVFGRLVYMASLRDQVTGQYVHFGFAQRFSAREADRAIRRSHENTFNDWLNFSVEEQRGDLDNYLGGLDGKKDAVIANWTATAPFVGFMPPRAQAGQRDLFFADMGVLLSLLRLSRSAASYDRDA